MKVLATESEIGATVSFVMAMDLEEAGAISAVSGHQCHRPSVRAVHASHWEFHWLDQATQLLQSQCWVLAESIQEESSASMDDSAARIAGSLLDQNLSPAVP
jgi:hypothetical protein